MAQTAKTLSIQDSNGQVLSPTVNLETIYYEDCSNGIISRKLLHKTNFPVKFEAKEKELSGIQYLYAGNVGIDTWNINSSSKTHIPYINTNTSILAQNFSKERILGTNTPLIKVQTYDLSDIISHYNTKGYINSKFNYYKETITTFNNSISNANTNIKNSSINIHNLDQDIRKITIFSSWSNAYIAISSSKLIPNHLYQVYYSGTYINNGGNSGAEHAFNIILRAKTTNSFYEDAEYVTLTSDTYFGSTINKWKLKVAYNNSSIYITYMKDEYGNEAQYDFKNYLTNGQYTFNYKRSDGNYDYSKCSGQACYKNIINSNPGNIFLNAKSESCQIINNIFEEGSKISINNITTFQNNILERNANVSIIFNATTYYNDIVGFWLLTTDDIGIYNFLNIRCTKNPFYFFNDANEKIEFGISGIRYENAYYILTDIKNDTQGITPDTKYNININYNNIIKNNIFKNNSSIAFSYNNNYSTEESNNNNNIIYQNSSCHIVGSNNTIEQNSLNVYILGNNNIIGTNTQNSYIYGQNNIIYNANSNIKLGNIYIDSFGSGSYYYNTSTMDNIKVGQINSNLTIDDTNYSLCSIFNQTIYAKDLIITN